MENNPKEMAEAYLLERGYEIIPAERVKKITQEALFSGQFVESYDNLVNSSDDWVEEETGRLVREFYRYTENSPEGEYAKAVALFDEEGIYDLYVVDHDENEI
jgi:hypothetical protein